MKKNCIIGDSAEICADDLLIDEGVKIEPDVVMKGKKEHIFKNVRIALRTSVFSHVIHIDENTRRRRCHNNCV